MVEKEVKYCPYCGKEMGLHDKRAIVSCEPCVYKACAPVRERLKAFYERLKKIQTVICPKWEPKKKGKKK